MKDKYWWTPLGWAIGFIIGIPLGELLAKILIR
jgi:hypothetical protein